MAMCRDRIDSSVPALVKRGFIGLMQIGEIDGLVIAWREANVAQHLSAVRTFALDANCEGGALPLPTQHSARPNTESIRERLSSPVTHRIHHPCTACFPCKCQHSGNRLLRAPALRTSRALQCPALWPQSASGFTVSLLPAGHQLVLLQFEAVGLVPHAMSENKQRTVRRIGSLHPYRSSKIYLAHRTTRHGLNFLPIVKNCSSRRVFWFRMFGVVDIRLPCIAASLKFR